MVASLFTQQGAYRWTPPDLGADLIAWWDADAYSTLTLSGSLVDRWDDKIGAIAVAQATGGSKPAYQAAGFNGRPCLSFDGVDDYLTGNALGALPVGANPCEIWFLADQTVAGTVAGLRHIFAYGGNTNPTVRRVRRTTVSNANLVGAATGDGVSSIAANATGDYSGKHVIRSIITATQTQTDFDGVAGTPAAAAPATGAAGYVRVGTHTVDPPAQFKTGLLHSILVTALLDATEAANLLAYLRRKGGI